MPETSQNPTAYYERLGGVEHRMDAVEKTLSHHSTKLDAIITAVSGHSNFDALRVMLFIVYAVAIVGGAGTAITYIATSVSATHLAQVESRVSKLEFMAGTVWESGEWRANTTTIERSNRP